MKKFIGVFIILSCISLTNCATLIDLQRVSNIHPTGN